MRYDLDHIALNVHDVEGMLRFYMDVLGLKPERLDLYRNGKAPFPSVRVNADTIIDLFPPEFWQGKSAGPEFHRMGRAKPKRDTRLNHFCLVIRKQEWPVFLRRLKDSGVAVEEGPVRRWGAHGTGISVYFSDPEGNRVEVRHYPVRGKGHIEGLAS